MRFAAARGRGHVFFGPTNRHDRHHPHRDAETPEWSGGRAKKFDFRRTTADRGLGFLWRRHGRRISSLTDQSPIRPRWSHHHVASGVSRDRPRVPRRRPGMQQLLRRREQLPPPVVHGISLAVPRAGRPVPCAGVRARLRPGRGAGALLRRRRHGDSRPLIGASRGRARHVQLTRPPRADRPAVPAPPVTRRSCRPRIG